jgi:hypothetical protein
MVAGFMGLLRVAAIFLLRGIPVARLAGFVKVTVGGGAFTVNVAVPDIPLREAVINEVPLAAAVARPVPLPMVATAVVPEVQVARVVTSAVPVVPSEFL